MADLTIQCPHCKQEFKLTESLAAPLIEQAQAESQKELQEERRRTEKLLQESNAKIAQREAALKAERDRLAAEKLNVEETARKLADQDRKKIAEEEARKAHELVAADINQKAQQLKHFEELLKVNNAKLAEAQKAQADLLIKQRELDDARREMELTVQKRVTASLGQEREKAQQELRQQMELQKIEYEQQSKSLQKKIDELKQQVEQGSQQLQGEAQEINLEETLHASFPHDGIEPVPKGKFGGDVVQKVINPSGAECGVILWESKRTKNWSDGWLAKLRRDQRDAKAQCAVLMSQALPPDVTSFALIHGIWVTSVACALPLAMALRQSLIDLHSARMAGEGQQSKMQLVYQYLTGQEFRQRVETIVEAFQELNDDLQAEKKAMQKLWAKREKQIELAATAMSGMYGDLQGIAGKQLKEIQGLDIKSLGAGD